MTPDTTNTPADPAELTPPPDLAALVDQAYANGHNLLIDVKQPVIRMVSQQGGVLAEVWWADAPKWFANILRNVMASTAPQAGGPS